MKIDFQNQFSKKKKPSLSKTPLKKNVSKKVNQLVQPISILNPELRKEYLNYLTDQDPSKIYNQRFNILGKKSFDSDVEFLLSSSNEMTSRSLRDDGKGLFLQGKRSTNAAEYSKDNALYQQIQNKMHYGTNKIVLKKDSNEYDSAYQIENEFKNGRIPILESINTDEYNRQYQIENISKSSATKDKNERSTASYCHLNSQIPHAQEYSNTNKIIFESVNMPKSINNTVDPKEILKMLGEDESHLKELLYNIPNYFFTLKQELINTKNILEKVTNDYNEQTKVYNILENKANALVLESNEKSEKLLKLANENEAYKNKQRVLDLFKEETQGYLEILKKDNEEKTKEIEALIQENSEYKIRESKGIYERDLHDREKSELVRNFKRLEIQKEVIKEDVANLKKHVETTFSTIVNSGIFEKVVLLEKENSEMLRYLYIYKQFSNNNKLIKSALDELTVELRTATTVNQNLIKSKDNDILKGKVYVNELESRILEINEFLNVIRTMNTSNFSLLENFIIQITRLKEIIQQDVNKKELLQTISSQRKELETQRLFYEKKIKELTEKLEEHEDVWDVFE